MHETFWGDVLWLWGNDWGQHGIFIMVALVILGALRKGWLEVDNAERLNKRLRADEALRPPNQP